MVGAGPAGLAAATALAAERLAVLVLEEHDQVGDPVHCTGVLGLDAFAEFDLPRDTICTIARTARFHGRHGRSVRIDGGEIAAAVIDRGRFDRALADRAVSAGAVIDARRARAGRGGLPARRDREDPSCRWTSVTSLDACAFSPAARNTASTVSSASGFPARICRPPSSKPPFPEVPDVEIDLDRSLAPRGFAWIVPFRRGESSMARIGLMATDRIAVRFGDYHRAVSARHGAIPLAVRPRLRLLPLAPVKRTYGDRVLAVGDAAGLAKPTTGGGIYYSLLSGRLAAEVLVSALAQDRTDAATLRVV